MQAQVGSQSLSGGAPRHGSPATGAMPHARSEHSAEPSVHLSTDRGRVHMCTRSGSARAGLQQRVLCARLGGAAHSPPLWVPGRGRGVSPVNSPRRKELANRAVQAFCGQACEGSYACELNHCANARSLRAVAARFFGWEAGAALCMRFPPRVVM